MKSKGSWSDKKFIGEWGKTLQNYILKKAEIVPKEYLTGPQALKKMGLYGAAGGQRTSLLREMVNDGFLAKKNFRILDGSGRRVSSIVHYKITGKS